MISKSNLSIMGINPQRIRTIDINSYFRYFNNSSFSPIRKTLLSRKKINSSMLYKNSLFSVNVSLLTHRQNFKSWFNNIYEGKSNQLYNSKQGKRQDSIKLISHKYVNIRTPNKTQNSFYIPPNSYLSHKNSCRRYPILIRNKGKMPLIINNQRADYKEEKIKSITKLIKYCMNNPRFFNSNHDFQTIKVGSSSKEKNKIKLSIRNLLGKTNENQKLTVETEKKELKDIDNIHNHEIVSNYISKIKNNNLRSTNFPTIKNCIEEKMFTNQVLRSCYTKF